MNRCKERWLYAAQQRAKAMSIRGYTGTRYTVWYGLRLVYWDASPVVKSHRSQLLINRPR